MKTFYIQDDNNKIIKIQATSEKKALAAMGYKVIKRLFTNNDCYYKENLPVVDEAGFVKFYKVEK